jgi:hypothetical protein
MGVALKTRADVVFMLILMLISGRCRQGPFTRVGGCHRRFFRSADIQGDDGDLTVTDRGMCSACRVDNSSSHFPIKTEKGASANVLAGEYEIANVSWSTLI